MRNVWTICMRELKSYFGSPIPYVVGAAFLAFISLLFNQVVLRSQEASLRYLFPNTVFVLAIVAPVLTMRLLAEEQRMGTIEMLLTAPVREWEIVVGKYLGSFIAFVVILFVPSLFYVGVLALYGKPDYPPIITGYIGIFLLGGSFLAIGFLTSSVTQNQIIAGFLGIILLLFVWLADIFNSALSLTGWMGEALSYIAIPSHMDNMFKGVIEVKDIVYALSVIAISLFLSTQILQSRRWR